jgi:hypothetical protein
MKESEILHIILAIFILAIVIGFESLIQGNYNFIGKAFLYSFLIIGASVAAKKWAARTLDASVEHKTWFWQRWWFMPWAYIRPAIPAGVILPLFLSAFSLGFIKFMGILGYQTSALTRRAARRYGYMSFTEMTDMHNSLVGAAGIVAVLLVSFITYFIPGLDSLPRMAAYYAFWNLIPFSQLDGLQIFIGSKTIWTVLAIVTLIFVGYALVLI